MPQTHKRAAATSTTFTSLAISEPGALVFGRAPKPVECGNGLTIGTGEVYPEINFTLPTMAISDATWPEIIRIYQEIGEMIGRASRRLHLPGVVVEFELLPPMTEHPGWGAEITSILSSALKEAFAAHGIRSALRVTPTDIRDVVRPPVLRSGEAWQKMRECFEQCARAGSDILSIESVGGKEVHDEAMMYGDVEGIIFALGVLAPRDMKFLWDEIVRVGRAHGITPGGDTACGFANTAMQMASQGMLPEVLAAVIRAASAVRSLVAVECGAVGPSKDCAYEGPVLKAITGIPISMEGKSASCAHFSPVGNIAAAMCDLWSNESVQNVRLLSGSAPEAFLELLAYDCRLFNTALKSGAEGAYRDLLVRSDVALSPQAAVLSPEATLRIASAIVHEPTPYRRTVAAAREATSVIRDATLTLSAQEQTWLSRIERVLQNLPGDEDALIGPMMDTYGGKINRQSYGL